jgi:hypothetical protein
MDEQPDEEISDINAHERKLNGVATYILNELIYSTSFDVWIRERFGEIKGGRPVLDVMREGHLKRFYQLSLKGYYKDYQWELIELKLACLIRDHYREGIINYQEAPF